MQLDLPQELLLLKHKESLIITTISYVNWEKVNLYICKGTYGIVYKVMHKFTKEIRAVKMIAKNGASSDEEEKLRGEIKVLKEMVTNIII